MEMPRIKSASPHISWKEMMQIKPPFSNFGGEFSTSEFQMNVTEKPKTSTIYINTVKTESKRK